MSHRGITCEINETASGPGFGTRGRRQALHPLRGDAPVTWRYTRSERVQCLRIGCNAYGSGAPHNARIPQRGVCRPARITRKQEHTKPQDPQAPPVWRPPRGLRGLAGPRDDAPSHTTQPRPTGVEGTGGICRGAGGRRRGLAGLRADAASQPSAHQAPQV